MEILTEMIIRAGIIHFMEVKGMPHAVYNIIEIIIFIKQDIRPALNKGILFIVALVERFLAVNFHKITNYSTLSST